MPFILDGMASLCCAASLEKQRFSTFALLTWLSWSTIIPNGVQTLQPLKISALKEFCIRVKHRLHKGQRAQSRERWRFAKQIQPDLDCGKKEVQWEGAVRQVLPNGLGYFILLRACARRLYHMTPAYFASTWLGDCMPRHVMMWSLDCRWYTASCFLPSSRLYIRMCR